MEAIQGTELGLVCGCGRSENFERVVVERKPNPPIVTDFVACVACRAMYHSPVRRMPPGAPGRGPNPPTLDGKPKIGAEISRKYGGAVPSASQRSVTAAEKALFYAKVAAAKKSTRKR